VTATTEHDDVVQFLRSTPMLVVAVVGVDLDIPDAAELAAIAGGLVCGSPPLTPFRRL
jgi:hypothetical protein